MKEYDFRKIEGKWQGIWSEAGIYRVPQFPKKKYYVLEMYPYPSGDLHMGQFRNYVIGDVIVRYRMMNGYEVLHPMGFDAFGLPAENAAIKRGIDPETWTMKNIGVSRATIKLMGISYDWDREVITCKPDYYKWTQWVFLTLYKMNLAYRKKAFVNWCSSCQTVLANEQVVGGVCERCKTPVTKTDLEQWFFKITDYAERLLEGLDRLPSWSDTLKTLQRYWIGKSEGCEIDFALKGMDRPISVFTTRPDTVYGVTFMAVAPENPLCTELARHGGREAEVKEYVEQSLKMSEIERTSTVREKDGVYTGSDCVNPFTGENVQMWVADYVLASYGTGIVMGVPAHDQRDFEFAKKYGIPIKVVIDPPGSKLEVQTMDAAYTEPGTMVNSGMFNGRNSEKAIDEIIEHCIKKGIGRRKTNYRLRDWLVSRQRYWGAPIPMIHCRTCGIVPVPESDLPVLLPREGVDFTPRGKSPLASVPGFMNVKCPKCGGDGERDPDTMDTFVCSSWYHLRYSDARNAREPFGKKEAASWLPIDEYIGGIEHACGHLIYFRFMTKVLHDAGCIPSDEPCVRMFNHGMITDENGDVMSKSKGNALPVGPFVEKWGADTGRIAMLFIGPPGKECAWSERGTFGAHRFLKRVWKLVWQADLATAQASPQKDLNPAELRLLRKFGWCIGRVTQDIHEYGHNTAIAAIMELVNEMQLFEPKGSATFAKAAKGLVQLLSPFAPHMCEELWHEPIGAVDSVFKSVWPNADLSDQPDLDAATRASITRVETIVLAVQVNGKVRGRIEVPADASEEEVKQAALAEENVKRHLSGVRVKKLVVVPGKIVSIVTQ
jgi:leucyl-tRNA synthetase